MVMDDELREMCFRGEPTLKIREYALQSGGMYSLRQDGSRKVLEGATSIEEVLRVVAAI
jgi:type II secretory ATPase GspE/PulE/Tfp pilus assembly ATPase PilB-like protein